jgi:hypothetical protein
MLNEMERDHEWWIGENWEGISATYSYLKLLSHHVPETPNEYDRHQSSGLLDRDSS